jgi:DNA-binding transcriptional LysR family regulator
MRLDPIETAMAGQVFPSLSEAARALGVSVSAVWLALEQGREVGGKRGRPGVRCYVDGRVYPSVKAASEAMGITPAAVSKRRAKQRAG